MSRRALPRLVPGRGARGPAAAWLLLTIVVSLGFALYTASPALTDPLVVHDDVRQHVFWVPRLHDPALFPNDPIADYYQSQAPPGYSGVYWLATLLVDAVLASKLVPLILTAVLAGGAFALGRTLWARDDAAALGAILLTWSAWQYDDVASATPRAFAMPLLTLQLAALGSGRFWLALGLIVLTALLYPLGCALMAVTTGLWLLVKETEPVLSAAKENRSQESGETIPSPPTPLPQGERGELDPPVPVSGRGGWGVRAFPEGRALLPRLLALGAATALALLIVFLSQRDAARFGPTVTAAQARTMSEFLPGGRSSYFIPDPYKFWIESTRSGLALVPKDKLLDGLPALTIPFLLAVALGGWIVAGRLGWTARPAVPRRGMLLLVLLVASFGLFFAAHLLLFTLYLPARHVQFSLPIVWAMAGGLFWALLADRFLPHPSPLPAGEGAIPPPSPALREKGTGGVRAALCALAGVLLLILHPPPIGTFYVAGRYPAIYAYLHTTPVDTRVAALPTDSSIIPLFGQRAVLTSFEHALPYQLGYYEPFRERTRALDAAYYAPTLSLWARLIDDERIGVIVANTTQLERRHRDNPDRPPALERLLEPCGLMREHDLVVLSAACVRAEVTP